VIEVRNLTKYFGDLKAVDDISFSVQRGEVLGFLGPNAAGKTTTMRILTGFMPASEGTASVAGYDVFENGIEVKRRVGYLPENPPLYRDMTVTEYLRFAAQVKGVAHRALAAETERVIERVSIGDVRHKFIDKLSKGYKQRVGLAQALLNNPPVLVFDEPTVGLDPKQIIEVRELIRSLGEDHTVILSTHILPEVSMTCSRVVIINAGRLVAVDTPANLTARLKGSETIVVEVAGAPEEIRGKIMKMEDVLSLSLHTDAGVMHCRIESKVNTDIRGRLAALIVNGGWELRELRREALSLEDVFLKLTTREEELD